MRYFFLLLLTGAVLQSSAQVGDTTPPFLECRRAPYVLPLTFPCYNILRTQDLIDSVSGAQETGIRKVCTGTGFPDADSVLIYEMGLVRVDIWARDNAGNTAQCQVEITVIEPNGFCDPHFTIQAVTPQGQGIPGARAHIAAQHCYFPPVQDSVTLMNISFPGSYSQFGYLVPAEGYDLQVTPRKDNNPVNGITTADIVRIRQHLLGIAPFTKPEEWIAADVNQDGQITTYDLVLLQRLILGISDTLPQGRSWRFWPADYTFPPSGSPLSPPPPDLFQENAITPIPQLIKFFGVKIGDPDGSADPTQ